MPKKSSKNTKKSTLPDFEAALVELEEIAKTMEHGEQPLEEALANFERGIALARSCQQALANAEQKIEILMAEDGTLAPLETRADETDDDA